MRWRVHQLWWVLGVPEVGVVRGTLFFRTVLQTLSLIRLRSVSLGRGCRGRGGAIDPAPGASATTVWLAPAVLVLLTVHEDTRGSQKS